MDLWYFLKWPIYFGMLGISVYFVDVGAWTRFKKWLYDMWYETPAPLSEFKGLMYGRSAKRQIFVVSILSTIQGFVEVYNGDAEFMFAFLSFWMEGFMMMVGFRIGGRLYPLLRRQDEFFDKVDEISNKVEGIDIATVRKDVREKVEHSAESFLGRARALADTFRRSISVRVSTTSETPVTEPAHEEPKPDPREKIDKFLKGR